MPKKTGVTVLAMAKTRSQASRGDAPRRSAEDEGGAAEDDPQQRQREGDVEGDAERGEDGREDGEDEHDDEDQPDVVRLPDGADGAGDRLPLLRRRGVRWQTGPRCRRRSRRRRGGRRGSHQARESRR